MKLPGLRIVTMLSGSFWFVPSLIVLCAMGMALGLILLDRRFLASGHPDVLWVFGGGADGARSVLSAIAASMITVTGVTFSITVVALTLAAQQYTPRVLQGFASDRGNQIVLGTFLATFVYSLLVLRTIRGDEAGSFVPHLAVTGGVLLALVSVGLLIYFIHHVAASLRPNVIVAGVAAQTHRWVDQLYPEGLGPATEEEVRGGCIAEPEGEGAPVATAQSGYLQTVDLERLMRVAREADLVVRREPEIGDFLFRGEPLATVWPAGRLNDPTAERIRDCFGIGRDRTIQQDPAFGVRQIVDIAIKALSPGINDPTTAFTCIDYLGDILRHLGDRKLPPRRIEDEAGALRLIDRAIDFDRMTDLAFDQIRQYCESAAAVIVHLLETIIKIATGVPDRQRRAVLARHVMQIAEGAERGVQHRADREKIERHVRRALQVLQKEEPHRGRTPAEQPHGPLEH